MDIIRQIQHIGKPERRMDNLVRRVLKAAEETGELAEAALSLTSESGGKGKELIDVIEEAVDVAIMGLDVAMTKPEEWQSLTDEQWIDLVETIFEAKLAKWRKQVCRGGTLMGSKLPSFTVEDRQKFIDSIGKLF